VTYAARDKLSEPRDADTPGALATREVPLVTDSTLPSKPRRDTSWHRDGKAKGIYWRPKKVGGKEFAFFNTRIGRREGGCRTRQEAIEKRSRAILDKGAGLPAPDMRVRISDLAEELCEAKRRRLRASSFVMFEHALRIILPELGHLKPAACGPDRVARLIRDLEGRGLKGSSIKKYLTPLSEIFKLAVRRGIIPSNPMELLTHDERPHNGTRCEHFRWSPETISNLIGAAEQLGKRPDAKTDYAPLITLLTLTGLRIGEALGLRWGDVDLLGEKLNVRSNLNRDGTLGPPKTDAGKREVWLSPGLVEMLLRLKGLDATDDEYLFAGTAGAPISYTNFRKRGFAPAVRAAGLEGNGLTVHSLRHAAASVLIASGLSVVDVAAVLGHSNAAVTLSIYAHLFHATDVAARVRAAQDSLGVTDKPTTDALGGGHEESHRILISHH
jgi:integrase